MIKQYQLRKQQNTYEVTLYFKGVKVRVAFTGGNIYKGIMPTFVTDNLFKMKAIEASELFKTKEVVLLRTTGEVPRPERSVVQQRKRSKPVVKEAPKKPAVQIPVQEPVIDTGNGGTDGGGNEKDFNSVDEAILYVAQTFGQAVTTEKEARDVLKANGITPHIKKGQ